MINVDFQWLKNHLYCNFVHEIEALESKQHCVTLYTKKCVVLDHKMYYIIEGFFLHNKNTLNNLWVSIHIKLSGVTTQGARKFLGQTLIGLHFNCVVCWRPKRTNRPWTLDRSIVRWPFNLLIKAFKWPSELVPTESLD